MQGSQMDHLIFRDDFGHGQGDLGHGQGDLGHGQGDIGHGQGDLGHSQGDLGHQGRHRISLYSDVSRISFRGSSKFFWKSEGICMALRAMQLVAKPRVC